MDGASQRQAGIVDGQTGIVIQKEDPGALSEAINRMLANPDEAAAMGRRGRERALQSFGWERFLDDYDRLYQRLLAESAGDPENQPDSVK